jgi:aspartyl-tRNA(Asn)/glutamyl-tRNA(Gln) amidotransferase subunit C
VSPEAPFIDAEAVRRIARLARLGLDDETVARLQPQLAAILEMFAGLAAVETEGVAPAVLSGEETRYRLDRTGVEWPPEGHLQNAPEAVSPSFRVPRVV